MSRVRGTPTAESEDFPKPLYTEICVSDIGQWDKHFIWNTLTPLNGISCFSYSLCSWVACECLSTADTKVNVYKTHMQTVPSSTQLRVSRCEFPSGGFTAVEPPGSLKSSRLHTRMDALGYILDALADAQWILYCVCVTYRTQFVIHQDSLFLLYFPPGPRGGGQWAQFA